MDGNNLTTLTFHFGGKAYSMAEKKNIRFG